VEAQILEIQELGLKGGKVASRQTQIRRPTGRLIGFDPPDFQASSMEAMMPVMVMPVVVMTPVVVPMPVAIVADPARAIIGPDHPAAVVRIIIRVVVIGRVEVPMKAVVPKREPAVAEAAAVENTAAVKAAAMEHGPTAVETAAVKRRASAMEAAAVKSTSPATMPPTAMTTTTAMAATAMTTTTAAADFGRQPVGGMCHRRRRARIDQRQRFRALVGGGRQHQHRSRRKAQRTNEGADQPAPRIWNFHHA
jgi:hypothetical protein